MSIALTNPRPSRALPVLLVALSLMLAALAVGPDNASATLLCDTSSCEPTGIYPDNTALSASLQAETQSELITSLGKVACKSSAINGSTAAETGEPLPFEITALTFSECKLGKTSCTVTTTTLPTEPSLEATGEGSGTFSMAGGQMQVTCGFLINCLFAMPTLQLKGGNPASLSATEVTVLYTEGEKFICPDTSKLTVTYTLSKPAPAYLVPGEAPVRLCDTPSCAEGIYPAETALSASLEKGTRAKLLTSSGTLKCESSTIAGKTTAESGTPLPLKITELAFGECELEGKEACTVTTETLPTSPYLEASGEGNGTLGLTGGKVNFKCGFFIRCTYAIPTLLFEGGSPASFGVAEAVMVEPKGLVCPETAKLHVAYTLSEPTPSYLVE